MKVMQDPTKTVVKTSPVPQMGGGLGLWNLETRLRAGVQPALKRKSRKYRIRWTMLTNGVRVASTRLIKISASGHCRPRHMQANSYTLAENPSRTKPEVCNASKHLAGHGLYHELYRLTYNKRGMMTPIPHGTQSRA